LGLFGLTEVGAEQETAGGTICDTHIAGAGRGVQSGKIGIGDWGQAGSLCAIRI